ncbi:MAG: DUF6517 family protein [Halobacteriaceae archaeon]
MVQRRTIAAVITVAVVMTTAGCGFILGSEPASFTASPATVSQQALDASGYEEVSVTPKTVSRNFSAAGQTRTVKVTNQLAQYERQIDLGPLGSRRAGVFVAFTSPSVSVLGQSFNPIADMSTQDLVTRFESQYEGLTVGSQVGSRSLSILGESRTVDKYAGTARLGGKEIDVYIEITEVFNHGSDHVVAVAIYPQQSSGSPDRVATLFEGLQHERG